MANREQHGNRETKKPRKPKPKVAPPSSGVSLIDRARASGTKHAPAA
jgi:hypothetical protein